MDGEGNHKQLLRVPSYRRHEHTRQISIFFSPDLFHPDARETMVNIFHDVLVGTETREEYSSNNKNFGQVQDFLSWTYFLLLDVHILSRCVYYIGYITTIFLIIHILYNHHIILCFLFCPLATQFNINLLLLYIH